jgi:hypothetical protein
LVWKNVDYKKLDLGFVGKGTEEKQEPDANDQWLLKYPTIYENIKYAPRDMLALLKNLDTEIGQYESMLIDEIEKRKKYKVCWLLMIYLRLYIELTIQMKFVSD